MMKLEQVEIAVLSPKKPGRVQWLPDTESTKRAVISANRSALRAEELTGQPQVYTLLNGMLYT